MIFRRFLICLGFSLMVSYFALPIIAVAEPSNKTALNFPPSPQRIVSLNLCADQLLMEMLPPERLVGITHLSMDPGISYHHKKATLYTTHKGRIEEIIALKPDLIIAGEFTSTLTNDLLENMGYSVLRIGLPKTALDIKEQLLMLGQHVNAYQQANTIGNTMSEGLFELSKSKPDNSPRAAIYYANGFSAGKQTIVHEALTLAGFKNIAAEQGLEFIAPLSMESLIKAEPDVLILGRYQDNTDSMAHQVLKHPALKTFIRTNNVATISMPDKYWDCAGPALVSAVAHLQHEYHQQVQTP